MMADPVAPSAELEGEADGSGLVPDHHGRYQDLFAKDLTTPNGPGITVCPRQGADEAAAPAGPVRVRLFRWDADNHHGARPVSDAVLGDRTEEHAGIGRAPPCAHDQQGGVGGLGQQGWAARSLDYALADRHLGELRADLGDHLLQRAPGVGLEVNTRRYPGHVVRPPPAGHRPQFRARHPGVVGGPAHGIPAAGRPIYPDDDHGAGRGRHWPAPVASGCGGSRRSGRSRHHTVKNTPMMSMPMPIHRLILIWLALASSFDEVKNPATVSMTP